MQCSRWLYPCLKHDVQAETKLAFIQKLLGSFVLDPNCEVRDSISFRFISEPDVTFPSPRRMNKWVARVISATETDLRRE